MKPEPRTIIVNIRMSPTEVTQLDELVIATGNDRPTVIREALKRMRSTVKLKTKR